MRIKRTEKVIINSGLLHDFSHPVDQSPSVNRFCRIVSTQLHSPDLFYDFTRYCRDLLKQTHFDGDPEFAPTSRR